MRCPYCSSQKIKVIDKRVSDENTIRRRRECLKCKKRFTTYERTETDLIVIKKKKRRERFDRNKIRTSIIKACEKRPISLRTIEKLTKQIETEVKSLSTPEIRSNIIGDLVIEKLKAIDEVAYVRFASYYKHFQDIESFKRELEKEKLENERMKKLIVEKTIKPAINFIKNIENPKVVIIHHDDSDGCCSGAILALLIKKIYGFFPKMFSTECSSGLTLNVVEEVEKETPDFVILADIPALPVKLLRKLNKKRKILVIDHHPYEKYRNAIYCNPILYKNIYLPTSYLAYKIYKSITGLKDICWIAGTGVLGDNGVKNCVDIFEEIKNSFHKLVDEVDLENMALFENSLLGELAKIVDSAKIVKGKEGAEFVSKVLLKKNHNEILNGRKESKTLLKWYDSTRKEFERLIGDFKKNKKFVGKNIIFYEIKSKYKVKSSIGIRLTKFLDKEILVIGQNNGKYLDLSFRKGKEVKIDLGNFTKEMIKNVPESFGGGHTEAAAARLPKRHLKRFIKNLSSFEI